MIFRLRTEVPRATHALVIANCAIFAIGYFGGPMLKQALEIRFGLSLGDVQRGCLWQFVTYQFLHGNWFHLLVNMLGLWFAGRELERVTGTRVFVLFYLIAGIVGGMAQIFLNPGAGLLIGASGSVFGVLLAMTTLFPELPITALIFFVLPIRMKAKYLGYGIVAASIIFWLSGFEPNVGHLAHLGGAFAGFLFAKCFAAHERRSYPNYEAAGPHPDEAGFIDSSGMPIFEAVETEAGSLDAVLEKVLRDGIDSLTRRERKILEDARGRRGRRWG